MNKEEILEQLQEKLANADKTLETVTKGLKNKASKEDVQEALDAITEVKDLVTSISNVDEKGIIEYVKEIQEHVDIVEKNAKDMFLNLGGEKPTLNKCINDVLGSQEWKDNAEFAKKGKRESSFILKAAADLLTSDWTADSGAIGLPQMYIPGVTAHPWRNTPIYASLRKFTVGEGHELRYTEELTRTDSAAVKTEGSASAQSAATWISKILAFYVIDHHTKVSRESLEDVGYMNQVIDDLLRNGLLQALESLLYDGSGTSTIKGVKTSAKTFQKPNGALPVTDPSIRDVLLASKLMVAKGYNVDADNDAGKTGYKANMALVGAGAGYNIMTEKDDIGRPLVNDITTYRPGGLTLVESDYVDETADTGDFVVGDFTKAAWYAKRNLVIETGYDSDDFTKGLTTVRCSIRGNMLIKALEEYAFCTSDWENAKNLIAV